MTPLIFSREALKALDRRAVEDYGIPILVLMENAGRAVADAVRRHLKKDSRVLVLAGPGNNGGDALVATRHLHNAAVPVEILLLAARDAYRDPAAAQLQIVTAMKLPVETLSPDHAELRDWVVESRPEDVIVDGLFGTGLSRAVEGLAADVIKAANASRHPVVAIDIPSGMDADTGLPAGNGPMIRALETISFCGMKKGFALPEAHRSTGKITIADIGAPRELLRQLASG